jgi:hypothetical protein
VRLANELPEVHRRGGEVVAVSVDPPGRNAALARRWHLPFPVRSDPGGEDIAKPLDAWNGEERGGIAKPTLLVVAPDGRVAYRYDGRDFADRPTDDDLLEALSGLDRPPVDPPEWRPDTEPEEDRGAFRADAFTPYFLGVRSSAMALARRADGADGACRREGNATMDMASSFREAWKRRRAEAGGS